MCLGAWCHSGLILSDTIVQPIKDSHKMSSAPKDLYTMKLYEYAFSCAIELLLLTHRLIPILNVDLTYFALTNPRVGLYSYISSHPRINIR